MVGLDFCCGDAVAKAAAVEDASVAQYPAKKAELGVAALVAAVKGGSVECRIQSRTGLVTPESKCDSTLRNWGKINAPHFFRPINMADRIAASQVQRSFP